MALKLQMLKGQLTIFNIYNDCTHSNTLNLLHQYLNRNAPNLLPMGKDHML